ncbi:Permease of the drug/metabolite transporter (DMT) superfamily [Salegentibacter holothuriorum]|uniref:Permease of the drug/metabolite transporter (DMT) superfamily n=1 Tax=Salegentibacter holothuriorum TaxID=241145 RepID=A0A1T5BLC3_9FLAO|nr:DMT family transporter [Salegentibacter holothuriorum]SKB48081.1 Permease of the drug/metabolite transporter (DMT) superfamily [Salegentibacter holothuriorum]
MKSFQEQSKAYLYAVLAVLLWSTVAAAMKLSLEYFDYLQLLFLAVFGSLISLFFILVFQKKLKEIFQFPKKAYLKSAVFGFVNPFVYYIVLFKAYSLLPAQEAQPLNYTWPIMITLLSIPILGQKISLKNFIAIVISFLGVAVISTKGNLLSFSFSNAYGAFLGLASAVIWALFWIYNIKDKRDEISKLFLNFLFGMVYISIALFVFSEFPSFSLKKYAAAAYVGFFEMGITFVIWSLALKKSSHAAKVSKFIYLVPFLSLIVIYFVLGETILFSTIVGLVFIVSGLIFDNINFSRLLTKIKNRKRFKKA